MNAPLDPTTFVSHRAYWCWHVHAAMRANGQAPSVTSLATRTGTQRGNAYNHVLRLVEDGLATAIKSKPRRALPGRKSEVVVSLTPDGVEIAERFGPEIPPVTKPIARPLGDPRASTPRRVRLCKLFEVGCTRAGRVVVCDLGDEVMTRCEICGFEEAHSKPVWRAGVRRACDRCHGERVDPVALAVWEADVPELTEPTSEEREEMLEIVLDEIGASPFTEDQRLGLAIAYLAEHHPGHVCTLEHIGACLALTRERVRQIEGIALDRLRGQLRRKGAATDIIDTLRELDAERVS